MHTNPIQIYSQRKQDEEKFVYIHTDPENVTQNRMKKKKLKKEENRRKIVDEEYEILYFRRSLYSVNVPFV